MIRLTLLILITVSILNSSCESRRSKLGHQVLIPEDELISILTDTYLTDGLLGITRIVVKLSPIDSVTTYNSILEKYGYSREEMDKTLKYYFLKKPKKLINIYDKVLGRLSEMESRIQKELGRTRVKLGSFWRGNDLYSFPDPYGNDSASFDIKLMRPGYYTLTATVTLFPDDLSLNPRLTGYSCHPDSIETGKKNWAPPIYYIKDGRPHTYNMVFSVPIKKTLHVKGCLYEYDNNPEEWDKHIVIQNITVTHSVAGL